MEIYDGDPERVQKLKQTTTPDFEQGLQHYFAREFVEDAGCFKNVLNIHPDDNTAKLYLERAAHFMVHSVPDDWQSVEAMERK